MKNIISFMMVILSWGVGMTFPEAGLSSVALLLFILCVQTVLFCGTALFLVLISYMDSYSSTLLCMTLAVACCGFYSCSVAMNPVDLAPNHSGAVFGKISGNPFTPLRTLAVSPVAWLWIAVMPDLIRFLLTILQHCTFWLSALLPCSESL